MFIVIFSIPTILFSHYPIFTFDLRARSSRNHSFKDIIRLYHPVYYLCGHLHSSLGGMIVTLIHPLKYRHAISIQSKQNNSISKQLANFAFFPIFIITSPLSHIILIWMRTPFLSFILLLYDLIFSLSVGSSV